MPTLIPDGFVQAKGEFDSSHVVVAIDDVGSVEMMHVDRVFPVTERGRQQKMTEFAGRSVVCRPRTVACRHAY